MFPDAELPNKCTLLARYAEPDQYTGSLSGKKSVLYRSDLNVLRQIMLIDADRVDPELSWCSQLEVGIARTVVKALDVPTRRMYLPSIQTLSEGLSISQVYEPAEYEYITLRRSTWSGVSTSSQLSRGGSIVTSRICESVLSSG